MQIYLTQYKGFIFENIDLETKSEDNLLAIMGHI